MLVAQASLCDEPAGDARAAISEGELEYHLAPIRDTIRRMARSESEYERELATARAELLEELIEREMILSRYRSALSERVPPSDVERTINARMREALEPPKAAATPATRSRSADSSPRFNRAPTW